MTNLALILKSLAPSACVEFYSIPGMRFLSERHDDGPEQFAAAHGDFLLEVLHGEPGIPCDLVLAMKTGSSEEVIGMAKLHRSHVMAGPSPEGGVKRIILRDPDGRKVMVYA